MANKLSEEIVAHSVSILQSALGQRFTQLLADKSIDPKSAEIMYSFFSKEESALKTIQTTYSEEISCSELEKIPITALFSLENIEVWFSFPKHSGCLWSSIYINSSKRLRMYINYLDIRYELIGERCWHNRELNTLIHIFYLKKYKCHVIVVMKNDESAEVVRKLYKWTCDEQKDINLPLE